jgi:hypothetical protein
MQNLAIRIEHDKYRESEAAAIVQALHQGGGLLGLLRSFRLSGIVVHMDILKVLVDNLADGRVVRDEVGKTQAPDTPVASHLTDDELTVGLGFGKSLVNLFEGIDFFIVHLLQGCLSIRRQGQQQDNKAHYYSSFHKLFL